MLKCILIDDEPKALTTLLYELAQFSDRVRVQETFTHAEEAVAFLGKNPVDAVFLDVEMPGMDGFAFLERFEDRSFDVVFTTAYDKYALEAIRNDVVDYLVKPIDPDDLEKALSKLEKNVQKKDEMSQKILDAIDRLNEQQGISKKIKLSVDRKIVFLDPDEIIYCESDGNYCRVFLEGKKELFMTQKLKNVEDLLPNHMFYRVHNSYIVNLLKIKEFHKNENFFLLTNNAVIPISRQRKNDIMDIL